MRHVLTTILALLLPAVGAMAQAHWTYDANQWAGETVIYCDLVSQSASLSPGNFEVAAFVDDEVRATSTLQSMNNTNFFLLRVKGSEADNGKEITFKAYNRQTQMEYDLTVKEQPLPITYDGETKDPGQPSNLRHLYLEEITAVSIANPITIGKGETVDLMQYVTFTPANATVPNNLTWDFANSSSYIDVEDNRLTGVAPTSANGVYLGLAVGNLSASTNVIVTNSATALDIMSGMEEITVNKGDDATLNKLLETAAVLTPADATDAIVWVSADETIVKSLAPVASGFSPVAAGTTTMTAQVLNADGSVRLSATLTVHVVAPVEDIIFTLKYLDCNVGDDISEVVRMYTEVYPADATNQEVTYRESSWGTANLLTIDNGSGTIVAQRSGTTNLYITSAENSQIEGMVVVNVHHPAKGLEVQEETLYVNDFDGGELDITERVTGNLVVTPSNFEEFTNEDLDVESSNEGVVSVGCSSEGNTYTVDAMANNYGEATITVSFTYNDYVGNYLAPNDNPLEVTVSKSFKVVVVQGLSQFTVETGDLQYGREGSVWLVPVPEDADYDSDQITIGFESADGDLPEAWQEVTITETSEVDGQTLVTVVPPLPGNGTLKIYYDGELLGEQEVSVGAPFDLTSGWQWRTINYGYVAADELSEAFGDDLVEVRSQEQLLYNDPVLGYFGDLALKGLNQNECYKIKMSAARTDQFGLYNGTLSQNGLQYGLNSGWTWIPNPYFYRRTLDKISAAEAVEGDRIVSKSSGFAEFDGSNWVGTLSVLTPGEGYLYSRENGSGTVGFANEFDFDPQDDDNNGGNANTGLMDGDRNAAPRASNTLPWHYDSSRFSDNMSIVAEARNAADLGNLRVGAFVGDECRGEGMLVGGRLFITVHGTGGEMVSFRFYSTTLNKTFLVNETLRFQQVAGSLKAPVSLTKGSETTGIEELNVSSADGSHASVYTLNGARVNTPQRGINLVRGTDGTVSKQAVR